ncbi:MAG: RnfABCDGE type electron transport complex subunit B [Oscillospiraceae bacterium]|jgi:Na+-translocating ferredoxin:NAD+ oxidoreductase RNF subunit RnfB|nr:RnfABCDGE type electron transport complex subunit B [Oscillospiraceae bacterium]
MVQYAVLALGGMGIVLGFLLAAAAKLFYVKVDHRIGEIEEALPGANCGGCGYAGCSAFAAALAGGDAEPNGCPAGGSAVAERLSSILGVETVKNTRLTALVRCSGGARARNRFQYEGIGDCHAAMRIAGGYKECPYGCIGLGSCVKSCPFSAISVVDGVAVVDHERCTGCQTCVSSCPKNIIVPVPYYADVNVACSSRDRGASLRRICDIGCLGCRICEKTCIHNAIHIEDNLAAIDFEKCTGCGDCAEKCPRKLIVDAKLDRGSRLMEV